MSYFLLEDFPECAHCGSDLVKLLWNISMSCSFKSDTIINMLTAKFQLVVKPHSSLGNYK